MTKALQVDRCQLLFSQFLYVLQFVLCIIAHRCQPEMKCDLRVTKDILIYISFFFHSPVEATVKKMINFIHVDDLRKSTYCM